MVVASVAPRKLGQIQGAGGTGWRAVGAATATIALLVGVAACGSPTRQRFTQQADSMAPTITRGDVLEIDGDRTVRRGDVVVFRLPKGVESNNPSDIKRVVALPGETISFVDGRVVVDGSPLDEPYLRPGAATHPLEGKPVETSVAAGSYFVLGDNRGQSRDSRSFGVVDEGSIIGVATKIASPRDRARDLNRVPTARRQ